jgi:two-component system response regulator MprA
VSTRATILLAEDNSDTRDAIAQVLSVEGYTVVTAVHGRQALDHLHGGLRPELILLDLMMPVMDGWEFRRVQLSEPTLAGIPVVLISAHDEVARAGSTLRAAGVVRKPVDIEEMLRTIDALCVRSN